MTKLSQVLQKKIKIIPIWIGSILLGAVAILALLTPVNSFAAGTVGISFSPTSATKTVGQTTSVNVVMNLSGDSSFGSTVEVLYDSNYLESPSYTYNPPAGGNCFTPNEPSVAGNYRFTIFCTTAYPTGTPVTFATVSFKTKAAGTAGLSFGSGTKVSGGNGDFAISSKGTANVVVQGGTTVTTQSTYNVVATVSPVNYGSVSGTGSVSSGGSKTLKATANTGYKFSKWGGNCSGTSDTYTLTGITANKSCVAYFVKVPVATTGTTSTKSTTGTTGATSATNTSTGAATNNNTATNNQAAEPSQNNQAPGTTSKSSSSGGIKEVTLWDWTKDQFQGLVLGAKSANQATLWLIVLAEVVGAALLSLSLYEIIKNSYIKE